MDQLGYPVTKIGYSTDKKIMETRQQLNEVMDVMRSNIEKMSLRADRLENLACRAEVLDMTAGQFHLTAAEVRRKSFWKTHLYKMVAAGIVVVTFVSGAAIAFF